MPRPTQRISSAENINRSIKHHTKLLFTKIKMLHPKRVQGLLWYMRCEFGLVSDESSLQDYTIDHSIKLQSFSPAAALWDGGTWPRWVATSCWWGSRRRECPGGRPPWSGTRPCPAPPPAACPPRTGSSPGPCGNPGQGNVEELQLMSYIPPILPSLEYSVSSCQQTHPRTR